LLCRYYAHHYIDKLTKFGNFLLNNSTESDPKFMHSSKFNVFNVLQLSSNWLKKLNKFYLFNYDAFLILRLVNLSLFSFSERIFKNTSSMFCAK
jgi:hypothetical protein